MLSSNGSTTTLQPSRLPSLVPAQKLRGTLHGRVTPHVSLREDGLDWPSAGPIPYSTTRIIARADTRKCRIYAVETIICTPDLDVRLIRDDAECDTWNVNHVEEVETG